VGKAWTYLKAAFLAPANVLGLTAASVGSAVAHNPMPAVVAAGVEVLYLGVLSTTPAFRRLVRARAHDQKRGSQSVDALVEELSPSQREHYFVLRELRDKIEENYQKLPGGRVMVAGSQSSVDALLTSFLRLVATLNHYRKYLNSADRETVQREATELEGELVAETHPRLREVKEKRLEIMRKRLSRFEQAAESREIISHQLAGIEDLLRLTHEQSIAIRDPETVSRQLDVLSAEVAASEQTVREMERFLSFDEELTPALPHGQRVR
jgi:hypothetical protein